MKRTKIICTLGPASSTEDVIEGLFKAGMNVGRLNFSHGTHESHKKMIEKFRSVRDRLGVSGAVLLDTKGPEVRLGKFEGGGCELKTGSEFVLTPAGEDDAFLGTEEKAEVTYTRLAEYTKKGQTILLDDGLITLTVKEVRGSDVVCKVKEGGPVSDRKGVTLKGVALDMTFLSEKDKADLLFGIENDVDYVAASFVRTREDAQELRDFLDANGGGDIKIIAKIENPEGVKNYKKILEVSDGIMVARGDMGVEIDYEKLPGIQKRIIRECFRKGKTSVTATQMLESMIENPSPTRAEITDIANAVFDGTSAVMLSGESAAGQYPVKAVEAMSKIAVQAERDAIRSEAYRYLPLEDVDREAAGAERGAANAGRDTANVIFDSAAVTNGIAHAAARAARDLDAKCILAVTKSGATAVAVSKFRPEKPIVACTPDEKTFHQLSLAWGVVPVKTKMCGSFSELFEVSMAATEQSGIAKKGDMVVATGGTPLGKEGRTNLIRVETV